MGLRSRLHGLKQGCVLRPLLYIAVYWYGPHQQVDGADGCHEEALLYADNLALVANGKPEYRRHCI